MRSNPNESAGRRPGARQDVAQAAAGNVEIDEHLPPGAVAAHQFVDGQGVEELVRHVEAEALGGHVVQPVAPPDPPAAAVGPPPLP